MATVVHHDPASPMVPPLAALAATDERHAPHAASRPPMLAKPYRSPPSKLCSAPFSMCLSLLKGKNPIHRVAFEGKKEERRSRQ
jgi:hypothetical protein